MFPTLKSKLVVVVSFLVFFVIACLAALIYLDTVRRTEHQLGERALGIAKTAASLIDGDAHQRIVDNFSSAADQPELQTIREQLRRVKRANNLKTDIYTLIRASWAPGNMAFVASSKDGAFEFRGQKIEPYVETALNNRSSGHTEIFETVNGQWITGYAPIITSSGDVSGLLEVALDTRLEVAEAKQKIFNNILRGGSVALAVSLLLTIFIAVSITKPVTNLSRITRKMAEGDFSIKADHPGNDEISTLAKDFNLMAENLDKSYQQLEDYNEKLETMVESRTAQIVAGQRRINSILENIEQGIISFGEDFKIKPELSDYCGEIFEIPLKDLAGRDAVQFIFENTGIPKEEIDLIRECLLTIINEPSLNWELNASQLPNETILNLNGKSKHLHFDWSGITNHDDETELVMLSIRDVTEKLALSEKIASEKAKTERTLSAISEIIAKDRSTVAKFFTDSENHFKQALELTQERAEAKTIFVKLHTIKGAARSLSFSRLMNAVHQAEDFVQALRDGSSEDYPKVEEKILDAHEELLFYRDIFENSLNGSSDNTRSLFSVMNQNLQTSLQAFNSHELRFTEICAKDTVIYWKEDSFSDVANILMHAINNSIDHGFIRPSKSSPVNDARLTINAWLSGANVNLEVSDNGNGINLKKLEDRYPGKNPDELLDQLFEDGVTTAENVSTSSGRGSGLAAIRALTGKLEGKAKIEVLKEGGTRLLIELPISSVVDNTSDSKFQKTG